MTWLASRACLVAGLCLHFAVGLGAQTPSTPSALPIPSLEGRVVDALGDGVPAAKVWVTTTGDFDARLAVTASDGQGVFVIANLPWRTTFQVHATADGMITDDERVRVSARSPRGHVEIKLRDADFIRGRVVDTKGKPVVKAQVWSGSIRTESAADGTYSLDKVPLGDTWEIAGLPDLDSNASIDADGFVCDSTFEPRLAPRSTPSAVGRRRHRNSWFEVSCWMKLARGSRATA